VALFHPVTGLESAALFAAASQSDTLHCQFTAVQRRFQPAVLSIWREVWKHPVLLGIFALRIPESCRPLDFISLCFLLTRWKVVPLGGCAGFSDHCWALARVAASLVRKRLALCSNWASPC